MRGFSDASRIVIPGAITDRMIGFNKAGQTKVWVNENFGMNHPSNQSLEAHLDENLVLNNLVNAVSPKLDLAGDFLNGVSSSRTLSNALSFVKSHSGVAENILEANRVNVGGLSQQTSTILNSNIQVQPVHVQQPVQQWVTPTTHVQPQQYTPVTTSNVQVYQPAQTFQPGYVRAPVHFVYPSGVAPVTNQQHQGYNAYQAPVQNKFSFTTAQ